MADNGEDNNRSKYEPPGDLFYDPTKDLLTSAHEDAANELFPSLPSPSSSTRYVFDVDDDRSSPVCNQRELLDASSAQSEQLVVNAVSEPSSADTNMVASEQFLSIHVPGPSSSDTSMGFQNCSPNKDEELLCEPFSVGSISSGVTEDVKGFSIMKPSLQSASDESFEPVAGPSCVRSETAKVGASRVIKKSVGESRSLQERNRQAARKYRERKKLEKFNLKKTETELETWNWKLRKNRENLLLGMRSVVGSLLSQVGFHNFPIEQLDEDKIRQIVNEFKKVYFKKE